MQVQFEHVRKTFQAPGGAVPALADLSFTVEEGAFVSLVGPSGCGKSTVLNILAGLEQPSGGRVLLDGQENCASDGKIGYMPQRDELFPWRTIWGNVTLGLELRRQGDKAHLDRVHELLRRYGLGEFERVLPSQLSGGMRQRCALIRTLATDPGLLLLDEPFSALDYQTRLSVSDDMQAIIRREGKTALLVTHDVGEAISMSDRVLVLSARPAVLRKTVELQEFAGLSPRQRREHPAFSSCLNTIWKELDHSA